MNKYLAVTTFPLASWEVYAKTMLASFVENVDIPLIVVIDEDAAGLAPHVKQVIRPTDRIFGKNEELQQAFLERHKGRDEGKDFRNHYVRFSHKVFATWKVAAALEAIDKEITHLIWIDADIIVNKKVPTEFFDSIAPVDHIASYMGRKDWSASETGFIIFDIRNGGKEFITAWRDLYVSDQLLEQPEKTDAFAFDMVRKAFDEVNKKSTCQNLTDNVPGRDVFDSSPMAQYMTHFKGPRKRELMERTGNPRHGNTFNVNNLGISTMNCVQDDTIKENVSKNLRIIEHWIPCCPPNDEEIVIANAGPSLPLDEIKKWYDKGVKIVAVKHALERLLKYDIVPWGCILLDPRQHVGEFIKKPNRDINYFVASMVDPSVTLHLRDMGCNVFGYHAMVNGGEGDRIPKGHILIQGGSATATRGISLLETMGFKTMHLYGYDCCYFAKPDLNEKKPNGKLKFEEVTLRVETWGGVEEERTVWTEGQFLAQVQEYRHLYMPKGGLKLHTYGNGVIPWMQHNLKRYDAWIDQKVAEQDAQFLKDNININDFIDNGTRKPRNTARPARTDKDSGESI